MTGKNILIDTSVWISYFRGDDAKLQESVDDLIENSNVMVPKIVIAELLQGAKNKKEFQVILDFTGAFSIIDQSDQTWVEAGMLSYAMKRQGITVGLIDCYIAVLSIENKTPIFTLDKHFEDIKTIAAIELFKM